jgi:hypothetical protein
MNVAENPDTCTHTFFALKNGSEKPAQCTHLPSHADLGVNSLGKEPFTPTNHPQQTTTMRCLIHPITMPKESRIWRGPSRHSLNSRQPSTSLLQVEPPGGCCEFGQVDETKI